LIGYFCIIIVPSFAYTVRRLHDVGKSGMFMLIFLIPVVGQVWLLLLTLQSGQDGDNRYGSATSSEDLDLSQETARQFV